MRKKKKRGGKLCWKENNKIHDKEQQRGRERKGERANAIRKLIEECKREKKKRKIETYGKERRGKI